MTTRGQIIFNYFHGNAAVLSEALAALMTASDQLIDNSLIPKDSSDTSTQECVYVLRLKNALNFSKHYGDST
jgi:hypothetical protein